MAKESIKPTKTSAEEYWLDKSALPEFSTFFSICFDGVNKSALPMFSKGIPMKPMTELVKDRQPLIGQQHIHIEEQYQNGCKEVMF